MGFSKADDKYEDMKKRERKKELEETEVGKRAEVKIRCDETGEQFIPDCDFEKYEEGKSEVESPHTGNKFKVTSVQSTNEEDMKMGLLGTEDEGLANKLDDGKFKDSTKGQSRWNTILLSIAMAFNAWLLFSMTMGWDMGGETFASPLFRISLTATVTGTLTLFGVTRQHQENDNWYFLDGMCVGHSEDNKIHYVIATSDDNYKDHLKAWFGEMDKSVKQSLDDLSKKNQETIDELRAEKRRLEVQVENKTDQNAEQVAERYEENRVTNEYRENKKRASIMKATAFTAIIMIAGFVTILYMMGWSP